MNRPLFVVGISYFIATWLAFLQGGSDTMLFSVAALLTAVLCYLLRERLKIWRVICVALVTGAVALAGFWLYNERNILPVKQLTGELVTIEGLVTEVESGPRSTTHTLRASFTDYPELPKNVTILVKSYGGGFDNPVGDTIRLKMRLAEAPDTVWYRSRGVSLTGYSVRSVERIPSGMHKYERAAIRLRNTLAVNLYAKLDRDTADVVSAMVLGMKSNVSPEVYSSVGRSGTVHLLSVSGLHLAVLSAAVLMLLRRLRCPEAVGAGVTILVSFLFTVIVGFEAAVFRSFVMTAMMLLGRMLSRRADSLTSLGLALLLCAVIWPHWTAGWSLWLSAGSTMGIIIYGDKATSALFGKIKRDERFGRIRKYIAGGFGVSVAAYAFTLPVLILMSGWVSLIAPLANVLIAPFVPIVILGGVICAAVPGNGLLLQIVARLTEISTELVIKVSEILGKLPFAIIAIDNSYLLAWLVFICVTVVVLILYRADKRLVVYAVALIIASFSAGGLSLYTANHDRVELVTLQGRDAAVLLRGGEAVILGTPDMYEISTLLKYLNFRGVRGIPAVIAADAGDTVGAGMLRLADAYTVDCVISPNDSYIEEQLQTALPQSLVYSGGYAEITVLGGVQITTDLLNGNIYIRAGANEIVKMRKDCDIIESKAPEIEIYNGGVMVLPKHVPPLFEPVGAHLFGESRVLLGLGG